MRSLIDSGSVVQAEDGKWRVTAVIDEITIPDTLQGAILARIDRLTEDTRQALQMAAVIGRRFRTQVLRSISEAKDKVDGSLAQLERDEMILPADSTSNEVYDFLDALVQEVAYENLLTQRRQVFHRRVGLALEELLADRIEQECELLAFHFRLSDDKERAIQYLEMAGRKAQAEFANETALNDYTELLELLDLLDDRSAAWEKRYEILRRRQQVYGLLARQSMREADLRSMLMLADQHNDIARRADTLNAQADLYQWTGRYGDARAFAQEALELKTALGDTVGQADALHQLGVIYYVRGDYVEAAPLLRQAVELRRAVQNAEGEAWSAMYLGMIDFAHGSYEQAAVRHERALELAQARQDIYQVGIHLTNAARVHLRLGEFEQSLEQFQQGLELKRRVGDRVGQGFNLFSLGTIALYLGNFDEADRLMRESLALRRDINDERGVSFSLNGLGLLALKRTDFEGALRCFGEAYEICSRLGLRREALVNLSCMSLALLGMERYEEALDTSEEALTRMEQVDVQQPHWLLFNHFRVLSSQSDPEAAAYLQRAYDALMTQADSISHPEVRQTFLQRVEENRLILDEADSGRWHIHKHDRALSQEN